MKRKIFVVLAILLFIGATVWATGTKDDTSETTEAVATGIYKQSPFLDARVASGELPPVDERLPLEPAVLVPIEEVGQYGALMNVFNTNVNPWGDLQEQAERGSFLGRFAAEGLGVEGNLAKGFSTAADGRSLTIHLREGTRWSDGAPFTADDFLFMFDLIAHPDVMPWNWIPEVKRVVKVDDYTVRWETDEPSGTLLIRMGFPEGTQWMAYTPSHYLQKWHIDYNSDAEKIAKEEGFETWQEAFNNHFWWIPVKDLSKPTMQPWVLTKSTTAIKVHERNPYYWKVDTKGQQLPYIDQIVTGIVDIETYHTKIISGEADMAFAKTQFVNFTLYKENEEAEGYTVHSLPGVRVDVGYIVNLTNLDPIKGPILRDVRLRQALSLATDADEVNKVIFSGLGTPRQWTVLPNASFYKPEWGDAYIQYDPEQANRLLDQVGLSERDRDGFRLGPDGKPFELFFEYSIGGPRPTTISAMELLKEFWEDVGLKVSIKGWERSFFNQRRSNSEYEIIIAGWQVKEVRTAAVSRPNLTSGSYFAPLWNQWLRADADVREGKRELTEFVDGKLPGEEPPEEFKQLFRWGDERILTSLGSAEYRDLSQKIFDFHHENLLMTGVIGMVPYLFIAKENVGNVPDEFITGIAGANDFNRLADQYFFK